ncbi:hypothetical protein TNCV_1322491 [Trichonephila clavipes]|nr:hypothetical protein TNCV_1322491 [Trichonephila clavipes]
MPATFQVSWSNSFGDLVMERGWNHFSKTKLVTFLPFHLNKCEMPPQSGIPSKRPSVPFNCDCNWNREWPGERSKSVLRLISYGFGIRYDNCGDLMQKY